MTYGAMTYKELHENLLYWQELLRLQDWDIDLQICRWRDMPSPYAVGSVKWRLSDKHVVVKILDPIDIGEGQSNDMEMTMVHELVHVMFAVGHNGILDDDSMISDMIEQAVERVATALINLDRR